MGKGLGTHRNSAYKVAFLIVMIIAASVLSSHSLFTNLFKVNAISDSHKELSRGTSKSAYTDSESDGTYGAINSSYRVSNSSLLYDYRDWPPVVPPEPREVDGMEDPAAVEIYNATTGEVIRVSSQQSVETGMNSAPSYEGLLSNGMVPESIIPPDDDRQRVVPTTGPAYRTICKLYITADDDSHWVGSGAIIGCPGGHGYFVLTAGHCIYMHAHGGWVKSVEIIPAFDDGYMPYHHAWMTAMWSYTGWVYDADHEYDMGCVKLDRNVGDYTGWMGRMTADPTDPVYTGVLHTAGYPTDLSSGLCMYRDIDNGRTANETNHWYYMDTWQGQSGSPVWVYYPGPPKEFYILTVHAYGDDGSGSNHGTRLTQSRLDDIDYYCGVWSPPTDYADLIDDGQAYSGFNLTTVAPGDGFHVWCDIRNIGTATSGGFNVSYYASTNTIISTADYPIGTDYVSSVSPFSWTDSEWQGTFPSDIPAGTYWIGWIIDSGDDVTEFDEDNNVAYKDSYQLTVLGQPDIRVEPTHLDFTVPTSGFGEEISVSETACQEFCESCCCPCNNRTAYPLMQPDSETLQEWVELYNSAPRAFSDPGLVPPTGSFSLLDHVQYIPSERNQGSCGNCWAWAGTGVLEVALDVQEGTKDRLSVQYLTSCWHGGTASDWACCGGWLSWFADWYQDNMFAISWSNTNAHWQDGGRTCAAGTSVPCDTISTSPNYPLSHCAAETIDTHAVGQAQAIANIKSVLHQNKAVWFAFFLPNNADWNVFFNFWNNEPESAVWNSDYSCGHTWVDGEGAGHAVLCVGYNDTDPSNSYWIMVNSWGTASGRPNGIFRVDMDINYDCYYDYYGYYYSLYWQTLNVTFGVGCQPITIYNDGNGDLEVTSIQCDQPWLSVSPLCPPSFMVPSGESQNVLVCVNPTGLSVGTYYGNVEIYSNDPDENPVTVTVTLYVSMLLSRFDFGTDSSPVKTGYTRITPSTVYSPSIGYGWDTSSALDSRDRSLPDDLRRDFVFSPSDRTFKVNVTDSDYLITVIVGDQSYPHDDIDIYAEGILKASISANAGEFIQEVFVVTVNDDLLDLLFHDGGGADSNWVINGLLIEQYTTKKFDFGTEVSPVEPGYLQATPSTAYSPSLGYGWTTTSNLWSRDRLSPDKMRRDFVFSSIDKTFKVDLSNGAYLVMVILGDQSFMHDNVCIYAEGALEAEVSVGAGEFVQEVFVVSVADGALDLMFHDEGGSDSNWVINALLIQPYYERKFDFGTDTSPVEPGYTQVLTSTSYSEPAGYGWADTADLHARDRGAPDNIRKDFMFSSSDRTFKVDLPNGKYMVVMVIGDNSFGHDYIDVYCEGTLVVNDLYVEAGGFNEVTFLAELLDGQLEIQYCDDGGANPHWVVNAIYIKTTFDLRLELDFGTNSSPVKNGCLRVTPTTTYLPSTSYGWSDVASLQSRDRGAPDALKRDFVFSSVDRTFNVGLPNGQYQVTLIIGDQNYMHDRIDISAEGVTVADDLTTSAGTFIEVTFAVTLSDGQLNIAFHDDGGADVNWVINGMIIESYRD